MNVPHPQHSTHGSQCSDPHRLGLFGGSFNPIHNGHLAIAHEVHLRMQLSRVLFIPTGDPPHKQDESLAPANARFNMVQLATAGTPAFDVTDIELRRKGKSYSIDTVLELREQFGPSTELFFIIGLDAFLDFHTWKTPGEILKICHFVVVPRPGQSFGTLIKLSLLPTLDAQMLAQLDAGAVGTLDIAVPASPGITCLSLPPHPISASEIRQRIRRGLPLANMLPHSVESYILLHSLYQEGSYRTRV